MSMNLGSNGKYSVPIQIGTWDSYMIFSDKDGGELGVAKRLRYYFQRERQERFNAAVGNNRKQKDIDEFWTELIKSLDEYINEYKKGNNIFDFYVW